MKFLDYNSFKYLNDARHIHYPAEIVQRKLPINIKENDQKYFEKEFVKHVSKSHIYELRNVQINHRGYVIRKDHILTESTYNNSIYHRELKWHQYKALLKKKTFIKNAIIGFDEYSNSKGFHYLCESLPRIYSVKDKLSDYVLLFPFVNANFSNYVKQTLSKLEINQFHFIRKEEIIHCNNLLFVERLAPTGNYRDPVMKEINWSFTDQRSNHFPKRKILYIDRNNSSSRKCLNNDHVRELLGHYNADSIKIEKYDFGEQLKILQDYSIILGIHGGGLSNMLFMNPNSKVIEIRNENDLKNLCYFSLASALDVDYFYLRANSTSDSNNANLKVDIDKLASLIEDAISC